MEKSTGENEFIDPVRLQEIRAKTDWQKLFFGLKLEKDQKCSTNTDWWAKSPFKKNNKATFHLTNKGLWYDFGIAKGGGVIELVQEFYQVGCYEAGRIILDSQWLFETDKLSQKNDKYNKLKLDKNPPIRQNLLPTLSKQGTHPEFKKRSISAKTCEDLGIGFLETGKSILKDHIVFQVRGIEQTEPNLKPAILSHIGYKPENSNNPWTIYPNFSPTLEIYNIDQLFLNPEAKKQTVQTKKVILTTNPWEVARLHEAGVYNAISLLCTNIAPEAQHKLDWIYAEFGLKQFVLWETRTQVKDKSAQSVKELQETSIPIEVFDWNQILGKSRSGSEIFIPDTIYSVCDMNNVQIQWLRKKNIIG